MKARYGVVWSFILLAHFFCSSSSDNALVSAYTEKANKAVRLAFSAIDREEASRGQVAAAENLIIKDAEGNVVWDMSAYAKLKDKNSKSAHPLLRELMLLDSKPGLYEVCKGIYQVRLFDISNITFIEGKTGWIVVDALTTTETARAALAFFRKHMRSDKAITAVIFTHSHVDHFGGILGIIGDKASEGRTIKIVAPKGFMEEAFSENLLLAQAMSRRAEYQFGEELSPSLEERLHSGIGMTVPKGTYGIIAPTDIIAATPTKMKIDGVEFIFQYTPDTEAPAEMTFYLPSYKAFCPAEIVNRTMHNLYTLRGAKVRDAYKWSMFINEAADLFPDAEVCFFTHLWPMYGRARISEHLIKQADMYRFIHDQTIRLTNKGFSPDAIASMLTLPKNLDEFLPNRSFYGVLQQNVKAVYQLYMGWYHGNPATLNPLSETERARRYVRYMGGARAVLEKAKQSYEEGDYRWVAEVLNHVVFAEPGNKEARNLLAKAYTQLGFQAESGVWRNAYLTAAKELSTGMGKRKSAMYRGYNMLKHMPPERLFDVMAVNLNPEKAVDNTSKIQINFSDTKKSYSLYVRNAVLHHSKKLFPRYDASLSIPYAKFVKLLVGASSKGEVLFDKEVNFEGSRIALVKFFSMFDKPDRFPIVAPE